MIKQLLHGLRQGLEYFAFFHRGDTLKRIDIVWMHREQTNELVHTFVHVSIEFGKWCQVLPDIGLLLRGLFEQTLGNHKFHIFAGNKHLLEAVLHPADAVCHEGKPGAIKDGFLHAGNEPESQVFTDLADFTEEVQIQDELLILPSAEIIKQFVHHQKQSVFRILLMKRNHHFFKGALVVGYLGSGGKAEVHAHRVEMLFQLSH